MNRFSYIPRLRFPTEIEFEPIQLCNALCFTCPYTKLQEDKEYRGKRMGRDNISALLTDFGNLLKKIILKVELLLIHTDILIP